MGCNTQDFRIEAVNAFWGKRNKTCVDLSGADPAALDGTHFLISDLDTEYYVWFNVDASSLDPAPAGLTGIEVPLNSTDTYMQIATALETAILAPIAGEKKFYTHLESGGCLCILTASYGEVVSPSSDVDTALDIENKISGIGGDLGCLADSPTITLGEETQTITKHQTGNIPIGSIITGFTAEVTISLLNVDENMYNLLLANGSGASFTPDGGTTLYGVGQNQIGRSSSEVGGELNLVPVNISDNSRTWTLFNASPSINGPTFSSTEAQTIEVTFTGFLAKHVNDDINLWAFGDPTQDISK